MADNKVEEKIDDWLADLYDTSKFTKEQLTEFYDLYQYQSFNRDQILKQLKRLVPDTNEAVQIIIVCALRGPRRAAETKLKSGRTIESYRIPASGQKGTKGISCQRITSATADLASYYLKTMKAPKRLDVTCPAHFQFPSAGAIKMNSELRSQHIEFSRQFSQVIGGSFNEQIYTQMVLNEYIDPKLESILFDIPNSSSSSSSSSATPKPKPTKTV